MTNKKSVTTGKIKTTISRPVANKKDNEKTIENHKQAAFHHVEAAKHYELGNKEKAAHSTVLAYGHNAIAGEFVSDDAKHHAQVLKRTNYRF